MHPIYVSKDEKSEYLNSSMRIDSHVNQLLINLINCLEHETLVNEGSSKALLTLTVNNKVYQLYCHELEQDVHLSPREIEVAQNLVKGLAIKEVARELEIQKSTVTTYVKRIYNKLNVNNRAEMVTAVITMGLIS